jgi:tight adherence protein C
MATETLLTLLGVFLTAGALTGAAASWWLARAAPERRRLETLGAPSSSVVLERPLLTAKLDPVLARLSRLLPKSPKDMSRLTRRLTRAGYPEPKTAVFYVMAEMGLPIVLGLAALIALGTHRDGWLAAAFVAVVGYMLPGLYMARKTAQRKKAIRNGLPDALDLLTICVEAGSALDQAIVRASQELVITHPELAMELQLVTTETRAGKPRMEAFKNLAQRTDVDDVRTIVSMLTQTDRFGTSVAQALRTHADTLRTKRRQRAEERAAKVGVKLVFPLALCLFPSLYVVCFGPVVVQIYRAFFITP